MKEKKRVRWKKKIFSSKGGVGNGREIKRRWTNMRETKEGREKEKRDERQIEKIEKGDTKPRERGEWGKIIFESLNFHFHHFLKFCNIIFDRLRFSLSSSFF